MPPPRFPSRRLNAHLTRPEDNDHDGHDDDDILVDWCNEYYEEASNSLNAHLTRPDDDDGHDGHDDDDDDGHDDDDDDENISFGRLM